MKKFMIMALATTLMFTFTAKAQDDTRDEPKFGLKAGFNISNVYDSQGEDFEADAKIGLAAGAFLSLPLGKFVGFQPEMLFSQRGFRGTGRFLGAPYEFTRTSNYVDLPLLLTVKPSSAVSIVAGPQFSYLVRQRNTFTNGTSTSAQEQAFDNENLRKNTVCFTAGADFHLNPVILSTRAGWDLTNNHGDGTSSTPRYKNVWVQLALGFTL